MKTWWLVEDQAKVRVPSSGGSQKKKRDIASPWTNFAKPNELSTIREREGAVTRPYTDYTPGEVASRGEKIYGQQICDKVAAEHRGKFVVIDIKTGDYEIHSEDLVATKRLLVKHPNAVIYGLRIGFPAAYRISRRVPKIWLAFDF